jgi:hypothetical protein
MTIFRILFAAILFGGLFIPDYAQAQDDDDIWRNVNLGEVDFQKERSYAVRLYGYYRYIDDGVSYYAEREHQYFAMYDGIFQLDIRYSKDEDDGALVIAGRDLVHPEKEGKFMDFYELTPHTFLEKARRDTRHFTLEEQGDTTRVNYRYGLAGMAVRDTLNHELRMTYNAIAPDTSMTLNLLLLRAHLSTVNAEAVYRIDDNDIDYVPQGNLKQVKFNGRIDMSMAGVRYVYDESTEIYIDSVVYMTHDEYRAANRMSKQLQRAASGYTTADIDRLRQKYDVPALTDKQRRRIEEQQDWDDMYEQWLRTRGRDQTLMRIGRAYVDSELFQSTYNSIAPTLIPSLEYITESSVNN